MSYRRSPVAVLAIGCLLAACSDTVTPLQPEHESARFAAAGPPAGFPVVLVRQGRGATQAGSAGAPIVDNLADALARVAPGGTVKVGAGTYPGAVIDKPVTLEAHGNAMPEIDGTGRCATVEIEGVQGGGVVISGLRLVGDPLCGDAVRVGGTHAGVLVEGTTFEQGRLSIGQADPASGTVTIRENVFGANSGVFGDAAGTAEVVANVFSGEGAVIHLGATDAVITDNQLSKCQGVGCIGVGGSHPDVPTTTTRIEDNLITVAITDQVPSGIFLSLGTHAVSGNVIRGLGSDPAAPTIEEQFPLTLAGVEIVDGAVATLTGNHISNAFFGIQVGSPVHLTGADNVVADVHTGISAFPNSTVHLTSSDFTDYETAMAIFESDPARTDLTCNWWGSAAGPQNANAPDPSVYTPWALMPVAGTGTTSCGSP